MSSLLSEQLSSFSESDYAVRAVRGLLGVLPFVPDWRHPGSLSQAAARLDPALAERVAARADALSREPAVQAALNSFELLDKGDKGIAIFSGLKAGYQGLKGQEGALEVDPQQAADAGLKAAGIAYATWKLFPGTTQEKAQALLASESGRSLLAFYVAVDVVLPFADNVAAGGVAGMTGIIEKYSAENAARLAPIAGQEVAEAAGMLAALSGTLSGLVGQAATFAQPLSAWAQEKLPGMLGTADKITGVVATAVDTLATYRYLGAALVAEVLLQRALVEVRAEVAELSIDAHPSITGEAPASARGASATGAVGGRSIGAREAAREVAHGPPAAATSGAPVHRCAVSACGTGPRGIVQRKGRGAARVHRSALTAVASAAA
ncbi:MAG TPA: hypothetical protein PLA94_21335 [Myxococcota bacterium]|nr:hypothetical protein [Myxococcota bacterium]